MKNIIIFLLLLVATFNAINAQRLDSMRVNKKNNIKVNTISLLVNTYSIFYERSFKDRFSASLGIGYKNESTLPRIIKVDDESFQTTGGKYDGFTITPEFRWYIKQCEGENPLQGFYLAFFMRYNEFSGSSGFNFIEDDMEIYTNNANLRLTDIGAGFMLGYQLLIAKRISVDFMIFGPRFSRFNFDLNFESELTDEFIDKLEQLLRDKFEELFQFDDLDLDQTDFNVNGKANLPNLRYGISIGYVF
jgi:hypothetical protein